MTREKQSAWKRMVARTPGFQKHAKRGFEIPYPTLFPSRISIPWKHEISLPLVILIPASRPSFELKSLISRRKNAESRIPPNLLGTLNSLPWKDAIKERCSSWLTFCEVFLLFSFFSLAASAILSITFPTVQYWNSMSQSVYFSWFLKAMCDNFFKNSST